MATGICPAVEQGRTDIVITKYSKENILNKDNESLYFYIVYAS